MGKMYFFNVLLNLDFFHFSGNGPSAITLSYMLSGNAAYYRGESNDEFLHTRMTENPEEPLVLQDLEFLSNVNILKTLSQLALVKS